MPVQLHLDADASYKDLEKALRRLGHDVTRTPNPWMPLDGDDRTQLLGATGQGRAIFTFNIVDFVGLAQLYPEHAGIILAAPDAWRLPALIRAMDQLLNQTADEDWTGRVVWLTRKKPR